MDKIIVPEADRYRIMRDLNKELFGIDGLKLSITYDEEKRVLAEALLQERYQKEQQFKDTEGDGVVFCGKCGKMRLDNEL